eukprot:2350297-Lingulodinium_polyedra.AAC.1
MLWWPSHARALAQNSLCRAHGARLRQRRGTRPASFRPLHPPSHMHRLGPRGRFWIVDRARRRAGARTA